MAKNYIRETTAKDAFSLWEHENPKLVKNLNDNIDRAKLEILDHLVLPTHRDAVTKLLNNLESKIVDLHIKFEDWCFDEINSEVIDESKE